VEAETEVVYGGVGRPAVLGCRVYSAPEAEVKWYRGTMLIEPDNYRYEAVESTAPQRLRSSGIEAPCSQSRITTGTHGLRGSKRSKGTL
jgi:hypothetical protein